MGKPLSRREFLKLSALLPAGVFLRRFSGTLNPMGQPAKQDNVMIVLFDAFSARHLSVNGYPRETTPNLTAFLEKATVYHNHFAGGNWTTPGTASLLTGTYPWTHQAFSQRDAVVKSRERMNIFNAFDQYHRFVYSQNTIPYRFFNQFGDDIDYIKPQKDLFTANDLSFDRLFSQDGDIASLTWDRIVARGDDGITYSLFFSRFYQKYYPEMVAKLRERFPRGIPHIGEDDYFLLEDGIDWLISQAGNTHQPFLGYFHFLPPHRPYSTRHEFINAFKDDGLGSYIQKPRHPFFSHGDADAPVNLEFQGFQRQLYDEFILYLDWEFGRLFRYLQQSGLLDNTWLVFTSDHGELFERGVFGHRTPLLYQPVIQIPLVIFEPGQQTRRDIFTPTSAVDVLPTLLKVTGHQIPDWVEGRVMPPYETPDGDRNIYALEATYSKHGEPLNPASVMLVKGKYKLTYCFGYEEIKAVGPLCELYDLEEDPEELNNIYDTQSEVAASLQNELLEMIREVDKSY